MLDALIAGERDAKVFAELALGRMRSKRVELRPALAAARFRPHHAVMLGEHLAHLDHLDGGISRLDDQTIGSWALRSPTEQAGDHPGSGQASCGDHKPR